MWNSLRTEALTPFSGAEPGLLWKASLNRTGVPQRIAEFRWAGATLPKLMSRKWVTLALIAAFVVIGVSFFAGWMAWHKTRQAAVAAFTPHEEQIDLGA